MGTAGSSKPTKEIKKERKEICQFGRSSTSQKTSKKAINKLETVGEGLLMKIDEVKNI